MELARCYRLEGREAERAYALVEEEGVRSERERKGGGVMRDQHPRRPALRISTEEGAQKQLQEVKMALRRLDQVPLPLRDKKWAAEWKEALLRNSTCGKLVLMLPEMAHLGPRGVPLA